jgi:YegS/Rv2252/BmrU family lipid kinase
MEEKKKYILVINPIAGGVDKSALTEAAKTFAANHNIELIEFETTGNDDKSAIRELYDIHKPDRILITGGDGTIKLVAEALEKHDVIMGLLPSGSANGLSVDLKFPTTMDEILKVAFHNDFMEIDMISINGHKSLHLSDVGLNAELIKNYENSSIRGKLGYAIQAVSTLTDLEAPFHAVITANGNVVSCDAKMIVIANSQKYGTGVTINPLGRMDDGKFEIVVIKNLDLVIFGKIVTGNMPLESDDIEIISTDIATITTDVPVHFQVDGEYCSEVSSLDIAILPRQMKIAVPVPNP